VLQLCALVGACPHILGVVDAKRLQVTAPSATARTGSAGRAPNYGACGSVPARLPAVSDFPSEFSDVVPGRSGSAGCTHVCGWRRRSSQRDGESLFGCDEVEPLGGFRRYCSAYFHSISATSMLPLGVR
jgi:hypothetical protein